jgi:hypothetical protein
MRLSLPRLTIFLALGVSPSTAFVIPSNRLPLTATPSYSAFSNTALSAKKKKGNTPKDAALAALEALEAQEQNGGVAVAVADFDDETMSKKDLMKQQKKAQKTKGAANGAPDLDALLAAVEGEGLTMKEQMALEKKKQKEAKKQKDDEEKKMKEEMEERERNKRKKALQVRRGLFIHTIADILCIYS